MDGALTPPPLGLYIHLPWCVQKCPYCDFNSHALRGELPEDDYITALLRDAAQAAQEASGRPVDTVFIGGGTPSLFSAAAIDRLLRGLEETLNLHPEAEITLEANPGTLDADRFEGFLEAGVNRLSIGVQSFGDDHLRRLGRIHGAREAIEAIELAQRAGFQRINADLMHGLPHQTLTQAVRDVDQALALGIRHISHYQLTLEPGTAFHHRPPALPNDDTLADIEAACATRLAEGGLIRYEVSAWSTPGEACQHNLNYWRFGDYLGIGAGAHAKMTERDGRIMRAQRVAMPRHYQAVAGTPAAIAEAHEVPVDERLLEYLMNALRLTEGTTVKEALERTGLTAEALQPGVDTAVEEGWLADDPERLQPTPQGQRFLNDLLGVFMTMSTDG